MTDCCNKERQPRSKMLSSHRATSVTDNVSKLGYSSVIFLDLGAKVSETYWTCFCHNSCCLSCVVSLASLYFRKQCHNIYGTARYNINISQGSVATPLRCGELCYGLSIGNFLLSVRVKEL